ncbi:hypothetical protein [Mesorhizobium australicum]|uniref:hypothetical protein n=1 Tax=Mesorhizobium australicum TaxID=536018 RepID=UPI003334BAE0
MMDKARQAADDLLHNAQDWAIANLLKIALLGAGGMFLLILAANLTSTLIGRLFNHRRPV